MEIRDYIIVPDVVKIKSNTDYIHYFSFAERLDKIFQPHPTKVEIEFYIIKDIQKPKELNLRFYLFYGNEDGNKIYYERPLFGNFKAKMLVENEEGNAKILVNSFYYNFVKFKIDNLFPPGINLTDITTIKLLEKGFTPTHSSCVSLNGDGILFFAPPNTGKSLTTFLAIRKGYHFLSEDITVIDKEYAYSCPLTSTFLYLLPNKTLSFKFYNFASKFGILSYFLKKPKTSFFSVSNNLKIDKKAKIKIVCILERGEEKVQKINKNDAFRRLLILNRNEFSYYKNPLLFAYSYFTPTLDLNKLMKKEEEIISTVVDESDCFLLRSNDPRKYIELLRGL